ncbi:helix-turn-helix domain-containing protein [Nocardia terpenica]|uniref:helix-turn-helix domain-containing protein n=1 Tax=Nocardia terpenica TaxID=455432 RepID=UPI001893B08D|nr:helix-turn-helix domain-containing protein [Nocardia terpenica]MBF6063465.1 helix-turn-helix domain-containing protein [Nocardia terpenica]MBF6106021.1 helix-turn-helix domain-containing protein [Nocardia terpenica]MBF6113394.1 helix-turn-helix domain-containing protein [Nocardia terpenica]MBF6119762.1 helix-turn-helix domain-containing protein [Nocardia terpenica]MBF6152173.1 helix-turn-helix domain-containing protein [Nocardia terpenica]
MSGESAIRARHRARRSPRRLPVDIPQLSTFLWQVRNDRGFTRIRAYRRTGVSESYITQIEQGRRTPSADIVEQFIVGYDMDPAQTRHVRELLAPPVELPWPDEIRDRLTSQQLQVIADLSDRDIPAVYIDPLWNILAVNDAMRAFMPSIVKFGNIARWWISPEAQKLVLGWDDELDYVAASMKPAMGRYRESQQTALLLRHLLRNKRFRQRWISSARICYGRAPDDHLVWRDLPTDRMYEASMHRAEISDTRDVLLCAAFVNARDESETP